MISIDSEFRLLQSNFEGNLVKLSHLIQFYDDRITTKLDSSVIPECASNRRVYVKLALLQHKHIAILSAQKVLDSVLAPQITPYINDSRSEGDHEVHFDLPLPPNSLGGKKCPNHSDQSEKGLRYLYKSSESSELCQRIWWNVFSNCDTVVRGSN